MSKQIIKKGKNMKLTAKHKKAMLKGREKITSGLVLKIDENIEIHADRYQYILSINSKTNYFPTLEYVFNELFEQKIKEELIESKKKDMETIIKIHKEVAKYLKKIFRNIEKPKFDQ